jgi:hypothetical protein
VCQPPRHEPGRAEHHHRADRERHEETPADAEVERADQRGGLNPDVRSRGLDALEQHVCDDDRGRPQGEDRKRRACRARCGGRLARCTPARPDCGVDGTGGHLRTVPTTADAFARQARLFRES